MALDPHARRFLAMLAVVEATASSDETMAERRQGFAALMRLGGPVPEVGGVADRLIAGPRRPIGIRLYTPLGASRGRLPGLVFFHGGGLVAGSLATHDVLCRALANASGCRIAAVDYRLAPEHKFPAALVDCYRAATWVLDHAVELAIDPERVAVGGDSAGGTLAAIVCQMARGTRRARFALQLLLCPILDFTAASGSRQALAKGYFLDQATMDCDIAQYLPNGIDPAHPRVSPLRARNVGGLPRALIHTAEFDPLRDEGGAYADRLRRAGVGASHTCHAGMIHLFYGLGGVIPYAQVALAAIGAELGTALAPSGPPQKPNVARSEKAISPRRGGSGPLKYFGDAVSIYRPARPATGPLAATPTSGRPRRARHHTRGPAHRTSSCAWRP